MISLKWMQTALVLGALCAAPTLSQTAATPSGRHIVVLGSSTAAGYGAPHQDSSWVGRYRIYLKKIDTSWTVTNLSVGAYTTYHVLPSRRKNPQDRPPVDTLHNLTYALSLRPSAIIISLPSNDIGFGYSWEEQFSNWAHIRAELVAANIPFWVATAQPYSKLTDLIPALITFRDWLFNNFPHSIDFWTDMAAADGKIKPNYNYDDVHPNNAGHRVLFQRVVQAGIPQYLDSGRALPLPPPPKSGLTVAEYKGGKTSATIQWQENTEIDSSFYRVQLSLDSSFSQLGLDTVTRSPLLARSNVFRSKSYFWRVQAYNTRKASPWSERFSFFVPPLQAPKPAYPPDRSLDVSLTPQIRWRTPLIAETAPPAAKRSDTTTGVIELFRLQIASDSAFSHILINIGPLSDTMIQVGPLDAGSTYFWRVRAENSLDTSAFSIPFRFTTMHAATIVNAHTLYAEHFSFSSGHVRFHLKSRSRVEFFLVDSRSHKISLMRAKVYPAGAHALPVSMPKTSGRYQLIMQSDRGLIAIPLSL